MIHASPKYNHIQDSVGVIPDDEPVFLLRGTDPLTPTSMRAWINAAIAAKVPVDRINKVREHLGNVLDYQIKYKDRVHLPGTPYAG